MITLALDTETAPILPGLLAPPLACISFAVANGPAEDWHLVDHSAASLRRVILELGANQTIVGHNMAYDSTVLIAEAYAQSPNLGDDMCRAWFAAYDAGKIVDTQICEKLLDLADGSLGFGDDEDDEGNQTFKKKSYSLASLVKQYFDVTMEKDEWRMGYGKLRGTPIEQWHEGARTYPLLDARYTLKVYQRQCEIADSIQGDFPDVLFDAKARARADFALHLMSTWGISTDPAQVGIFADGLEKDFQRCRDVVVAAGLAKRDRHGKVSKNMGAIKLQVESVLGENAPKTETGATRTNRETLQSTGDSVLESLVEYTTIEKLISSFIPTLRKGAVTPLNPGVDILKKTGRCSMFKPNLQQLPRKEGVRECFIPRPGFLFLASDYDSLELRTLAQVCLDLIGWSTLADLYQSDPSADPHSMLGATLIGLTYEEMLIKKKTDKAAKNARQMSKGANFGLPGGLGIEKFRMYCKATFGVVLSDDEAGDLKKAWFAKWPEMREYFEHCDRELASGSSVQQPRSKRWRGSLTYTTIRNTRFQGAAADGALRACYLVQKACYSDKASPLYGSRLVNFVHDELLLEVPDHPERAHLAAKELENIMNSAMSEFAPMIPITCSPALMRRWYKDASSVYDSASKLTIWSPK